MLKNYFKTSFRYFWNHKVFSLINIVGLTTGVCVCFFALLYVQFELSRDSYNKNADNIYRLVIIALLVASPLAWWAMSKWLQSFAYRIDIPLWVFLFSGLAAVFIALLTISFQSLKAALVNPVKSLRND